MKYIIVVMAVLFVTVYGFKLHLPTSSGTLILNSGFLSEEERR